MRKKSLFLFTLIFIIPVFASSISAQKCQSAAFPSLTFDQINVFPSDKSLKRPEDGKALPDGRIVVGDEDHGLRIIEKEGKHRPFGKFKEAGYKNTPESPGAPNGVFLERNGKYLLVTDVYTGYIYRVDIKTEETRIIYRHEYGVNSVIRDSRETIWFTESAQNNLKTGSQALYAAIDRPSPTGAVFMLPGSGFDIAAKAQMIADGIYLANGIAMNNAEDRLFVAETMMDRVLSFDINKEKGILENRTIYASVMSPDNLMIDSDDNLYIAAPISNSVFAVDAKCGNIHRVFNASAPGNTLAQDLWTVGGRTGKPLLSILGPGTFAPLPGILTGMFFSTDGKTFYVTGLGNALMRFKPDD